MARRLHGAGESPQWVSARRELEEDASDQATTMVPVERERPACRKRRVWRLERAVSWDHSTDSPWYYHDNRGICMERNGAQACEVSWQWCWGSTDNRRHGDLCSLGPVQRAEGKERHGCELCTVDGLTSMWRCAVRRARTPVAWRHGAAWCGRCHSECGGCARRDHSVGTCTGR